MFIILDNRPIYDPEKEKSARNCNVSEELDRAELKKALLKQKNLFAKNMVEKMLSYALGRELSPYDRPTVDRITKKVIEDEGRIQTAFVEVAKSYPMLNRRGDNYKPTPKTKSNQ